MTSAPCPGRTRPARSCCADARSLDRLRSENRNASTAARRSPPRSEADLRRSRGRLVTGTRKLSWLLRRPAHNPTPRMDAPCVLLRGFSEERRVATAASHQGCQIASRWPCGADPRRATPVSVRARLSAGASASSLPACFHLRGEPSSWNAPVSPKQDRKSIRLLRDVIDLSSEQSRSYRGTISSLLLNPIQNKSPPRSMRSRARTVGNGKGGL
jgi:hypothetical protein